MSASPHEDREMRFHAPPGTGAAREILRPLSALGGKIGPHLPLVVLVLVLVYAASGVTFVRENEVALVLRFGRLVGDTPALAVRPPGLLIALPRPFDEVVRVPVRRVRELRIMDLSRYLGDEVQLDSLLAARRLPSAAEPGGETDRPVTISPETEGYGLTGDNNIVQAVLTARYQISDPVSYALAHADPEDALRGAVLSATVRTLGEMRIDDLLTEGRRELVRSSRERAQELLDAASTGLTLVSLELEELAPPLPVIEEFVAVQSAYIERLTEAKRAQEYREQELPGAEAESNTLVREAESEAATRVAEARAAAESFRKLVAEYRRAPEVVRRRLFVESMERSLGQARDRIFLPPPPAGQRYEDLRITIDRGTDVATTADIDDRATRADETPPPVTGRDDALTEAERRDIAVRLGPILAGAGLLSLGVIHGMLAPSQGDVTALIQACAAAVVGVPIAIKGVRGFLSRPAQDLSSQLVTLALLAAMAYGDFVTATLVPLFMELGRLFEERSSRGARAAIDGIRRLSARRATRVVDGREIEVAPESLAAGDEVVVRPGEVVPVDGRVVAGHSSVDQAPITGESAYEEVAPGHRVFAGSVNLQGLLRIETTRAGADSALGRVVELLREVEGAKTPALRVIDRLAGIYLPAILAIAGVTLFVSGELTRAIAVLVVACPSALFLCGPVAMVATMTACTRLSILVKSATFLEAVPRIKTLVFDKTGTVTVGRLGVASIHAAGPWSEEEVLRAAAACGHGSRHPVSRAALEEAEARGLAHEKPERVSEEAGAGVTARSSGGVLRLGRASWLRAAGLDVPEDGARGTSGAWVARDDVVLGHLSLVDRPRESAGRALRATRELGVERLVLLTGDRRDVAVRVAEQLGFDDVVAEVLPEQKLDLVRAEQARGAPVMMVGDGINDALALSGADVGIAIGARVNEVALGGADIAVMTSDLTRLPILIDVARMTRRIVLQNILIVAVVALAMIALASLGIISPLVGAVLHNVDALFVVINSSRLLRLYAPS